jgi:hypothetical protein
MPYQVLVEYDGCPNWKIDLPDSMGTREECLFFIANHLPPKGCEFLLVDQESRRAVSYLLPATVVLRRYRLQQQDLSNV